MGASVVRNGDLLEITLGGRWSDINDAKEKVKEIAGRRWNPDKKVWTLPAEPAVADKLLKMLRPDCDDELMAWLKESMTSAEESLTSPLPPDSTNLLVPWAYKRMPWQPKMVNDVAFNGALPYQRSAIEVMAQRGRTLLADDMGLGKTLVAITAVEEWCLRNGQPDGAKLVIAPASVLGGWKRELSRWLKNANVQIVDGANPEKCHAQVAQGIKDDSWVIVNWEKIRIKKLTVKTRNGGTKTFVVMKEPLFQFPSAAEWAVPLVDWDAALYQKAERRFTKIDPWLAVVADEIHRAKNRTAQQTKGLFHINGRVAYGMTGTPLMNSPDELWAPLRWLWPDEYHERGEAHITGALAYGPFYDTYVDFWEDHFGRKIITGVKNPDALRFALRDKLIRRTASVLGLKGRSRFYEEVPLTPKQQKLYDEAEKAMWLLVEKEATEGNANALEFARKAAAGGSPVELMRIPNGAARFVRLQQIIENAALLGGPDESGAMDDFMQRYEDSRPDSWVVFCKYKASCDLLAARLEKRFGANVGVYTGDVSASDRTELENAYQRGEIDVLVGTIAAMYQGITLTRGHLQYWLSREVVPAVNEQGEMRQDRLGQQELVRVYIPQAPDTVAVDRVRVINSLKEKIVSTVLPMDEIKEGVCP